MRGIFQMVRRAAFTGFFIHARTARRAVARIFVTSFDIRKIAVRQRFMRAGPLHVAPSRDSTERDPSCRHGTADYGA